MELLFGVFQIIPLLVLALIVFAVAAAAGKREPDPTGRRPYGIYLVTVGFLSLLILLFASTIVVGFLSELLFDAATVNAEPAGGAVMAGLIGAAAALVFVFHTRRLRDLVSEGPSTENPAQRTYQIYLYAVCLLSVLTALITAALSVFAVVRAIFPSISGIDARSEDGLRQLIPMGHLAVAASFIFIWHWRRAAAFRTPLPVEPRPEAAPPV